MGRPRGGRSRVAAGSNGDIMAGSHRRRHEAQEPGELIDHIHRLREQVLWLADRARHRRCPPGTYTALAAAARYLSLAARIISRLG